MKKEKDRDREGGEIYPVGDARGGEEGMRCYTAGRTVQTHEEVEWSMAGWLGVLPRRLLHFGKTSTTTALEVR